MGMAKCSGQLHVLEKFQILALKERGSWNGVYFSWTYFQRRITSKEKSVLAAKQNDAPRKESYVYGGEYFLFLTLMKYSFQRL